jgi:hypothetical protein
MVEGEDVVRMRQGGYKATRQLSSMGRAEL